jgi:hypothetical protein
LILWQSVQVLSSDFVKVCCWDGDFVGVHGVFIYGLVLVVFLPSIGILIPSGIPVNAFF